MSELALRQSEMRASGVDLSPSMSFTQAVKIRLRARLTLTAHKPFHNIFTGQSLGMPVSSSFRPSHLWLFSFILGRSEEPPRARPALILTSFLVLP